MKTGLESLDTGAPEITYSGNEGPKSPQQIQMMQMAQLEEEYDAYVDDMLEQGLEPMSMQQFLEQIAAEAQMSSNEEGIGSMMEDPRAMAANGGIMTVKDLKKNAPKGEFLAYINKEEAALLKKLGGSGKLVNGIPSFVGSDYQGAGGSGYQGGMRGSGGYQGSNDATGSNNNNNNNNNNNKGNDDKPTPTGPSELGVTTRKKDPVIPEKVDDRGSAYQNYITRYVTGNLDDDDYENPEDARVLMTQEEIDFEANEKRRRLEEHRRRLAIANRGGGGQQTQPDGGTGDDNNDDDDEFPDIPTNFVDLSGTSSYTNPSFGGQYFYGTPTITLANGGRANYAGGGIADLRQGYFLGKLVKSITKPFKKVFKGFKKIAKSPLGKMALLALGGYYLGGGAKLGGSLFGNQGFGTSKLAGMFTGGGGPKLNLGGFSKVGEGFKNIAKSAFKPENAFATITGISGLSGLYTNYINNKREDESMADYQRRLQEERGNFADIPTNFVQFAANGGRMGFADGGDDDDDENFRQKALGALYQKLSQGGSAGMPPVTLQLEGQDVQSFGDDESTGMPQATPTMPNQMPMRPPMMDPRMQQMMAQRGNPMMNRGMMGMQQPRIMAQEGGMMDMGGMEKDYRNEGGFVAIGGKERADDVPARLSKNEFVFTADAVRNAGGGDIDKGAEIMENMMENLEAGGKVSKESQGLQGAREMFATSQRLEEVL